MHMAYAYGIFSISGSLKGEAPQELQQGGGSGWVGRSLPPGAPEAQAGGPRELWGRWNKCQKPITPAADPKQGK